jgi:PQQ-dependent catabolism-associated CXXCW motif protein
MKRWALLQFLLSLFVICKVEYGRAADTVAEPAGYRLDDYRAPTPATLKGAVVIDASTLRHLMLTKPLVVIDVLPQPPRPANLPSTTLWHPPTRLDIPGSFWLANTGYGQLSPEMDNYFRKTLAGLTLGDPARPLAFYCEARCWMSWNAAKRALSYGYKHVYWFPGGMQGWQGTGYPTLSNIPLPLK